ncbi:XdhC family protein [Aldersonia sp. NBC_00410]|uniref:XdhC family protein n=1 Tax=Aldersonia sp. NBC_00410 TaxID=2975954 RepID=UPI00225A5B48|nr:XdhC family protein [Aldersonia sp. NBC_00410]MCX5042823.1 XdhC family protein [Aldersonia sp. NBC_00410]
MNMSARAAQLAEQRRPFVHARVVRAQPPTSAHPGDEAILLQDGTLEGFVGGQCAQNSVRTVGLDALQSNESVLLRVLPDGAVDFPDAPGASVVVNPCLSGGAMEIFLEPQVPAPLLLLSGGTPIADALADVMGLLGFAVQRNDATEVADPETLSGVTAMVIASHGGAESESIRAALDAGVGYIGLVASRTRGAAVLAELTLDDAERARVHTPVGLWIGARTAPEIAVSIAAELVKAIRLEGLPVDRDAEPETPTQAIDPVCGMTVVIGSDTPHLELSGEQFWFCSTGCRAAYARDGGT